MIDRTQQALKFIEHFGTDLLFSVIHERVEERFAMEWRDLSEIATGCSDAEFSQEFRDVVKAELDKIAKHIIVNKKICFHPAENNLVDADFEVDEESGFYVADWIEILEGWQQYWYELAEEHFNGN
tara:strand:- start:104 stop:481 length:378 start_codon:yes stop_codon:yes gene_type:complete